MTTIKRFEDLEVWQIAKELTHSIYQLTKKGKFSKDFGLRDQIQRASVSVMSNIAEGFESDTQALFTTYLARTKASAGEIRCQLYIAFDLDYITKEEFQDYTDKAEKCSKQLFGFIKYLRSKPNFRRVK